MKHLWIILALFLCVASSPAEDLIWVDSADVGLQLSVAPQKWDIVWFDHGQELVKVRFDSKNSQQPVRIFYGEHYSAERVAQLLWIGASHPYISNQGNETRIEQWDVWDRGDIVLLGFVTLNRTTCRAEFRDYHPTGKDLGFWQTLAAWPCRNISDIDRNAKPTFGGMALPEKKDTK